MCYINAGLFEIAKGENNKMSRAHYAADLTTLLKIVDELNNSLMMPARRRTLETCKEALEVVLDLYEISNI